MTLNHLHPKCQPSELPETEADGNEEAHCKGNQSDNDNEDESRDGQ